MHAWLHLYQLVGQYILRSVCVVYLRVVRAGNVETVIIGIRMNRDNGARVHLDKVTDAHFH